MKVGILTLHNANNYGAVLQAYALQTYLLNSGIDVEIIDFTPNINSNKNIAKRSYIRKLITYVSQPKAYFDMKNKRKKFCEFRKSNFKLSGMTYYGDNHISKKPPLYDVYIVGSDQVWNMDITNGTESFFLDFVKDGRKLSYAASIGKDFLTENEKNCIEKYLGSFNAVSVREKTLVEILKENFSIDAMCVLDPVFLLDKSSWLSIETKIHLPQRYILCYMMEYSEDLVEHTRSVARQLKCLPIFISSVKREFTGIKLRDLGPREFLYVMSNAQYVCTNSFHGTAFSIIFEKNFTVVKHSRLNTRISSLLDRLGLNGRFLDSPNFANGDIDYIDIKSKLESIIEESKIFLRKNLEEGNETL